MTANVRHHIPDDLLMGYAAGVLPRAFDLVVATHVSLSDEARARLESFEAVGGAVIDQVEEAEVEEDSLSQTLARIDAMSPVTPKCAPQDSVFPAPLRDALGSDESSVKWRSIGLGAKQCVLQSDDAASVRLLMIPAGQAMPKHSHRGTEMTLVLQGAFRDEDGIYARGDIEVADEEVDHTPIAEQGEDCICLVATDARLKFEGLLPRIAQPFFGI